MSKNRTENPNIASERIDILEKGEIFVFGSNLAGHHMGGAARAAHKKFGAEWGVGVGLTGRSYAIPTMQGGVETIKPYVDEFIEFANQHQNMKFLVTRIGCGIAGFKDEEIAPLFRKAVLVSNIYLPQKFYDILLEPYLKHCFYYGKNVPEDCGAHVGHIEPRNVSLNYYNPLLISAVLGDIAGSIYEFSPNKNTDIALQDSRMDYTDDTIMTIAVADWILNDKKLTKKGLVARMQAWGRKYPHPMGAYGNMFSVWLHADNPKPYNSWGNGSAMRVAAVGFAFSTLEETLKVAKKSAEVTHNHPEGIKGAQATAAAIFLARTGHTKEEIRRYIAATFDYDMNRTCDDIRPTYGFDGSCQGTVPESIIAFLDSKDYEDALRLCISLGGDADTMGAITGAIAGAYYNRMPYAMYKFGMEKLPDDIKKTILDFDSAYRREVSYGWRNAEYDAEALIRKVRSGEIFY
ncbi:MAG: ADP-ribosylglycohydrolase family protein [Prevotella copri]|nr:ADP-ribosylglycohydrolase family protein [Segatella copri]